MKTKILSMILTLSMILSLVSVQTMAANEPSVSMIASSTQLISKGSEQEVLISLILSNPDPVQNDIVGVSFRLKSDNANLVLSDTATVLTAAFGDEAADYNKTSEYSAFGAMKMVGFDLKPIAETNTTLLAVNATLASNAPHGEYKIYTEGMAVSNTEPAYVFTENQSVIINVYEEISGTQAITEFTAPEKGDAPDTEVVTPANMTASAVTWTKADNSPFTGNFGASTSYKAKFTVTPKSGYVFANNVEFTVGGLAWNAEKSGNGYVLSKTFDATAGANELKGTVTINNTAPKFEDTLTANTSALDYNGESAGTLSYQWYRGNATISGAIGDTYTIASADVGKTIKVEVKNSNNSKSVMSLATSAVAKATYSGTVPSAPTLNTKTDTSIKVDTADGQEYSLSTTNTPTTWNTTANFTGLTKDTVYYVFTRKAATATTEASGASTALTVKTKDVPESSDLSFDLTAKDYTAEAQAVAVSGNVGAITVKYNNSTTAPTNAGTYTITADVAGNDDFVAKTGIALGSFTINPKNVTITPNSGQSKTYGEVDPVFIYTTGLTGALATAFENAKTGKLAREIGEDVNTYEITLGDLGAGDNFNLTLSATPVTFEINKADYNLAASFNATQTTIEGSESFVEPTYTGVNNEVVSGNISYEIGGSSKTKSEVQSAIMAQAKDIPLAIDYSFVSTDNNYVVTAKTGSFTVTVKDIEFKVGNDAATIDNALTIKNNAVYGDDWSNIVTIKPELKAYLDGTEKSGAFTLSVSGKPNAGNDVAYNIIFNGSGYTNVTVLSGTVNVAKKTLTASDLEYNSGAKAKEYDATTASTVTAKVKTTSLVNNNDVVNVTGTAVYNSKDVASANKITFTSSELSNANYALAAGQTFDITGSDVKITAKAVSVDVRPESRAYGETNPVFTGILAVGSSVATGEDYTDLGMSYNTEATTSSDVGNYDVTGTSSNTNYTVTVNGTDALTITKSTYTGAAIAQNKNVIINTAVNGVEVDLTSNISGIKGAAITDAVEGTDADNVISNVATDGNKVKFDVASIAAAGKIATITVTIASTNYNDFTATVTVTTSEKEDAVVTLGTVPTEKTYADGEFNLTATAENEGENGAWTWTSSNTSALTVDNTGKVTVVGIGTATITAKYESDTTVGEATSAPITVGKATITISAKNKSAYIGDTAPVLGTEDYTVTGLKAGEVLKTLPAIAYESAPDMTQAGTMAIKVSGAEAPDGGNYKEIVYNDGTLTISRRSSGGGGGGGVSSYTIKFDTDGGSTVKSQSVNKNKTVSEPTAPTKDGYTFDGWYTDKDLTEKYDFESKVTKSFTLYAKWVEDKTEEQPDETDKPETPDTEAMPFADVDTNDWYYETVKTAYEKGLMNGVSNTEFGADTNVTRGMFVTVLYRMENEPVAPKLNFTDVESGAYYTDAIAWANANNIVSGVTDTKFAPNDNITREQMATILFRYATYKGMDTMTLEENLGQFTDNSEISEYAVSALNWAVGSNVMSGKGNGILDPKGFATRAEAAAVLVRMAK